jgi:hypothetical protein
MNEPRGADPFVERKWRTAVASKMLATDPKKFSTRRSISGVFAPACTGGSAGRFSWPGMVTASLSQQL